MPESSNTATDAPTQPVDRFDEADLDGAVAANRAQRKQSPKAAPALPSRTAGDTRALPSRFHSFLPGMFR